MTQETYLDRIKKIKSERKITNEKLSDMTGIPLGTLSKLLAGISDSPKLVNMVAICRALECSLDYLMTGEPENTNNYTLTAEEITLVESYRMLDAYGRSLTAVVIEKERDRAARQAAEEALLLRNVAEQRSTRRGGRRAGDAAQRAVAAAVKQSEAYRYQFDAPEGSSVNADTPIPAVAPAVTAPTVSAEPAASVAAERRIIRGSLPAGVGRRPIDMYDLPVSAGTGQFLSESTGTEIMIPAGPKTENADYALRISGDSMEPKYHTGDVLLVEDCDFVEEGELGIFVLDGSGYFKKYGGDRLISLNPAYAPIMLKDFQEVICCGRVVGKLKRK
ncbi:MAG: helix-turn-helix domain-containing protein [Ruminococcaceae bacterium]|nr:helix-turn-helix domain-containing protein [Oscillospiraceae bacterium]